MNNHRIAEAINFPWPSWLLCSQLRKDPSAEFSLDILAHCSILKAKESDRVIAGSICLNSAAHGSALVAAAVVLVRLDYGAGAISD